MFRQPLTVPLKPTSASDAVVALHDLCYAWAGQPPAVEIGSLEVHRGERVLVRGPSGSGKSTLLSLLAGITVAGPGSVTVLGRDLSLLRGAARDRFRADHVGVIFQLFNLIPYLSVLENVTLPCRFSRRRRARALRRARGLDDEAQRLLSHLDVADASLLSRPVTALSVGQQQRVAAARALMGAPELILADEPTSSLDADRRAAFLDLLFHECTEEEATLLFVSHDRALEARFDRTVDFTTVNRATPLAGGPLREAG